MALRCRHLLRQRRGQLVAAETGRVDSQASKTDGQTDAPRCVGFYSCTTTCFRSSVAASNQTLYFFTHFYRWPWPAGRLGYSERFFSGLFGFASVWPDGRTCFGRARGSRDFWTSFSDLGTIATAAGWLIFCSVHEQNVLDPNG